MIETPYLLFLGDAPDQLAAKVAQGIRDWRPDSALGQLRLPGCHADLGLQDMTVAQAVAAGAKTLVVGVANRGGVISDGWIEVLRDALAQARRQGHLADWQSLRQLSAAERARTSLRLNQTGAYLELDIPLLRNLADPDWQGLVDALQGPGDMQVTINHADRLL